LRRDQISITILAGDDTKSNKSAVDRKCLGPGRAEYKGRSGGSVRWALAFGHEGEPLRLS
jgi:hypothetical protein